MTSSLITKLGTDIMTLKAKKNHKSIILHCKIFGYSDSPYIQ